VTARHIVTLEVNFPQCGGFLFHGASNAAGATVRAGDGESHVACALGIAVRALTVPRSAGDGRTSSATPSRGRADADSENRISNPAGVLYPQSPQTK
jgi:hypothetical protein